MDRDNPFLSPIAAAVTVWCLLAAPEMPGRPAAQGGATLDAWLAAAVQHRPGELDEPAETVARWPAERLTALLEELPSHDAADAAARNLLLKRLAMLHTDIAILHRRPEGYDLPATAGSADRISDGRQIGTGSGTIHWSIARGILDLVEPNPQADADVGAWYHATGAWLQQWVEYSELRPHLERVRKIFPDDAVFLLYLGTIHEAFAQPRVQHAISLAQPRAGSSRPQRAGGGWDMADMPSSTVVSPVAGPADELSRADTLFRQALERDPELHEARIRRARVASLRGRHADAVRELERAVAAPLPSALEYCARLFLGQSLQHAGRTAEAAAAFSRARELYPDALSPALGLSQLARARGDLRGALEALSLMQSRSSPAPGSDPWHEYHYTHQPTGEQLVERLRERWIR